MAPRNAALGVPRTPGTTYYFAVVALDGNGNASGLSPIVSATTTSATASAAYR